MTSNFNKKLKIFTFSLNTDKIKLCNKTKCKDCPSFDKKSPCSYCRSKKCYIPVFFKYLVKYIIDNKFDIVFIATQNDSFKDGAHLHEQYLEEYFKPFGSLIGKEKIKGFLYKTTTHVKTSKSYKVFNTGLSNSVFFSKEYHSYISKKPITFSSKYKSCNKLLNKGKGGLYTNITFPDKKNTISFVNINLGNSISKEKRDICIKSILNAAYSDKSNKDVNKNVNKDVNKSLICAGSFNYNVIDYKKRTDELSDSLIKPDIKWNNFKIHETIDRDSYELPFNTTCGLETATKYSYIPCDTPDKYKKEWQKKEKELKKLEKQLNGTKDKLNENDPETKKIQKKSKKLERELKSYSRENMQCKSHEFKDCIDSLRRKSDIYDRGSKWCDRILYSTTNQVKKDKVDEYAIKCTDYYSYDFGQFIANSTHKAIYATFELDLESYT